MGYRQAKKYEQILISEIDGSTFKTHRQFLYQLKKLNISEQEYYDKHLNNNDGKCRTCGISTDFISIQYGYKNFCSHNCSVNNEVVARKRNVNTKTSLLRKYGVENPGQMKDHREKLKKTCLEKYGDENYVNVEKAKQTMEERYGGHYTRTEEYKRQYKDTVVKKYGVDHHTKADIVKEKQMQTVREKYGVDFALQSPEIRNKIEATVNEKYGGVGLKSPIIRQAYEKTMLERYGGIGKGSDIINKKIINTNLEKYGCEIPTQNQDVINKMKKTNLKKYGVSNTFQLPTTSKTFMERYGVINASQIDGHVDKVKKTCLEKYGRESFFSTEYFRDKYKEWSRKKYGTDHPMQNSDFYKKLTTNKIGMYKIRNYTTKWGHEVTYQSIPELNFIKQCEDKNITVYDGPCIKYEMDGKHRRYMVDFIILTDHGFRLIEIKRKHKWWYSNLKSGIILAKTKAAQRYSKDHGFLPYKILFLDKVPT